MVLLNADGVDMQESNEPVAELENNENHGYSSPGKDQAEL